LTGLHATLSYMKTFLLLLTGGGLVAASVLLTGLLTNWHDAGRDKRRHEHEKTTAREALRQGRLETAYLELGRYLSCHADWARSVRPFWGTVPAPDPLPAEERWRVESLVTAYGSTDVRALLEQWAEQAKKIEDADELIGRVEKSRNPTPEMDAEAQREERELLNYKLALHKADEELRDRMRESSRARCKRLPRDASRLLAPCRTATSPQVSTALPHTRCGGPGARMASQARAWPV
jgi:hypothetical protein